MRVNLSAVIDENQPCPAMALVAPQKLKAGRKTNQNREINHIFFDFAPVSAECITTYKNATIDYNPTA
jgi:hypothetical protein